MNKILYNTLPSNIKKDFNSEKFNSSSYFQRKISNGKSSKEININSYSNILRNEIIRLIEKKKIISGNIRLEELHKRLNKSMKDYNLVNGVNKISQMFYDNDNDFKKAYFSFIKYISKKFFKFPFYFQTTPTIRFQCPDGKNNNHYPRYHNDIAYGHPFEEINLWIPLTKKSKVEKHGFRILNLNNSKKIIKRYQYNLDNFVNDCINKRKINFKYHKLSSRVNVEYGKMLAFDSRCLHTGEAMLNQTRVSIDIRIIPVYEYKKLKYKHQGMGKRKILFAPGKCYFKSSIKN